MNQLVTAAGMALLAMASVGLWTLRVALTARGRKGIAAAVAAVEAVVFAVAFTNVAAHLDSPPRIAGYAAGVAAGTVLGLTVDHRVSGGVSEVDIVVPARDTLAAERLRRLGWPATSFPGDGPSGPVTVICVAVDDSRIADLTAAVRQVAPDAFWTVQRLGTAHASALPRRLPADRQRAHWGNSPALRTPGTARPMTPPLSVDDVSPPANQSDPNRSAFLGGVMGCGTEPRNRTTSNRTPARTTPDTGAPGSAR